MRFQQAREILVDWTMRLEGKPASTNKCVDRLPRPRGVTRAWWYENDKKTPDWRNARTVAYLAAYVEIAGLSIPGRGIEVEEGYVHPDRAVIRSLLDAHCLRLSKGMLTLTERGEALIAPMLTVNGERISRAASWRDTRSVQ